MTDSDKDTKDEAARQSFRDDIARIVEDFQNRFVSHLQAGDPIAALEARLVGRSVELREFDQAMKWGNEYIGSLERIADTE